MSGSFALPESAFALKGSGLAHQAEINLRLRAESLLARQPLQLAERYAVARIVLAAARRPAYNRELNLARVVLVKLGEPFPGQRSLRRVVRTGNMRAACADGGECGYCEKSDEQRRTGVAPGLQFQREHPTGENLSLLHN